MEGQSYNVRVRVVVQPTITDGQDQHETPAWLLVAPTTDNRALGETIADDLIGLTVSNSLGQGYQTFAFTLAPRKVVGTLGWEDVLLPYTYVEIWAQRIPGDSEERPLLLGLIDTVEVSWDFSGPQPRRVVNVAGRSLAATLVDHRWWCNHYLSDQIIPPDLRDFFEIPSEEVLIANLRDKAGLRSVGILALDPKLLQEERFPTRVLATIFRWFVVSGIPGGDERPLVKLRFYNDVPLRDRLILRAHQDDFFDPRARLTAQVLQTSIPTGSAWQMMTTYAESPFTEIFSDTLMALGTAKPRPVVAVIARKPPWLGQITYPSQGASVGFSTGKPVHDLPLGAPPSPVPQPPEAGKPVTGVTQRQRNPGPRQGQSLFDSTFGVSWRLEDETEFIDASDIVSGSSLRRGLDADVYTLYAVTPQAPRPTGDASTGGPVDDKLWEQIIPPLIDLARSSPSLITRFGVRPLSMTTKYIATVGTDEQTTTSSASLQRTCLAYELLLRTWLFTHPLQWHGTYVLKGRADLRVGKRMVDLVRQREYYVTAVAHQFDFRQRPAWRTTVQVERGWDLT